MDVLLVYGLTFLYVLIAVFYGIIIDAKLPKNSEPIAALLAFIWPVTLPLLITISLAFRARKYFYDR